MKNQKMFRINSPKNMKYSGYTMVEILLVFAMIAIIAGFSMPIYQSFQVKNDLDLAAFNVSQALRRAQILSQAVEGSSSWGTKVLNDQIIMFKGETYDSRDANYDEIYDMPGSITPSGATEFIFSKLYGELASESTLILTSSNGQVKNLTCNIKGILNES